MMSHREKRNGWDNLCVKKEEIIIVILTMALCSALWPRHVESCWGFVVWWTLHEVCWQPLLTCRGHISPNYPQHLANISPTSRQILLNISPTSPYSRSTRQEARHANQGQKPDNPRRFLFFCLQTFCQISQNPCQTDNRASRACDDGTYMLACARVRLCVYACMRVCPSAYTCLIFIYVTSPSKSNHLGADWRIR